MNERFHRPVNTNLCETVWFNYYLQNLQILLDLSLPSCPLTHNPVCDVMMCSHKSVESVLWSAGAKIQKKKKNIYWLKLTVHKKYWNAVKKKYTVGENPEKTWMSLLSAAKVLSACSLSSVSRQHQKAKLSKKCLSFRQVPMVLRATTQADYITC